jgi:Spy/CpxP family protein refolding chaperone
MKKILLMITFLAGTAVFAQAQTQRAHKTPEQKAKHMTEALNKKLALSTDQSVKVNAIFAKSAVSMDSLKANKSADRKANMQARKAIMVNTNANLKTVLTADQQTKFASLKSNFKGRMHGKRGDHKGVAPEQKAQRMSKVLQKKLSLTQEQYAKVNTILLKRATQMDSLKANHSATTDRKAKMESRKAIMMQADTDVKAVLTADQQKNYTDLKNQFKERMKNRRGPKAPTAG